MKLYIPSDQAFPLRPVVARVGSALPIVLYNIPSAATAVAVSIVNADGETLTRAAAKSEGLWRVMFPASHFAATGEVTKAVKIAATFPTSDSESVSGSGGVAPASTVDVLHIADLRVESSAAGDPAGRGINPVPITEVEAVPDGSSMKDIRDKVNELARIVSGTPAATTTEATP